jgi:hypothetical protein
VLPQIFRKSIFRTNCDRCGREFTLGEGGVCVECRTILCDDHLHGGLFRRIRVNLLGAPAICTACRSKSAGANAA